jgi:Ice-binding-like/PEP-CTERM motif
MITQLHTRFSNRRIAVRGLIALAIAFSAGTASATSTPVTLGTASTYGVLVGSGDTLTLAGGYNQSGNIGVGKNSTVNLSGNNAISGNAYEDSGVTTNYSGNTAIAGTVYTQSMATAIADASNASTAAAALTKTTGLVDQSGSISLSGSSVTIKALTNLSENVLDISSLSLTNSTLTFDDNGYSNAKFIINITGAFSVTSSGSLKSLIQGINGASADDIIFNIEGTGSTVSITGNSTNQVIGTILAPKRGVSVGGGGSLTGAIIAGVNNAGTNYTVQSTSGGYNITGLGYTPRTVVNTPEPSSIALFGAGMFALMGVRRRLRRPRH